MSVYHTSVLFLGHVLLAKGISANPEKVEKIRNWPVSKKIKKVQSFLGLASHHRQFINQFAKKAWCLQELVGPTSNNNKKKAWTKNTTTTITEPEPRTCGWQGIRMHLMHWKKHSVLLQYRDIPTSPGNLFWRQMLLQMV